MDGITERIRGTRNKGRTHVFMGSPLSDGGDKTTVEPGNGFSPGVWTCGVTVWLEIGGELFSPDILPDSAVEWRLTPPVLEASYAAGPLTLRNRLAHLGIAGSEGVDFCELTVTASTNCTSRLFIAVRDEGPAGGKIGSMEWLAGENTLLVNGGLRLVMEETPDECRVYGADDRFDSPMCLLAYDLVMEAGAVRALSFKAEHGFAERFFARYVPLQKPFAGLTAAEGFRQSEADWDAAVPGRIFAPDTRVAAAYERSMFHILSAMECGLARIGAVNYPIFWLRDGVIILRALDLAGRHDLARMGNEYIAPLYFGGGFGAESDAPGEGIWALVNHAVMTKDTAWLAKVFCHIEARAEWLDRMLAVTEPIRLPTENRLPFMMHTPGNNIACLAAENGLIHGRMDGHTPDFYINAWAQCGYEQAACAAELLNRAAQAEAWRKRAADIGAAMEKHLMPQYGANDRDAYITPHPSGALGHMRVELAARFGAWYQQRRLDSAGQRVPEKEWTYFEAAHIHNAMLLGHKDMAWVSLDGMLDTPDGWECAAYTEGSAGAPECLGFRNGDERRGWLGKDAAGANMPHNWTSAELVCLLRDIFVVEEDGGLTLGKGVPDAWLLPGQSFGVRDMPTAYGAVSYTVRVDEQGAAALEYDGPADYRTAFAVACRS